MVRMVASELAGRRLTPAEVLAVEQGDIRVTEPVVPETQGQSQASPRGPVSRTEEFSFLSARTALCGVVLALMCVVDALSDRRRVEEC